MSSPLPTRDGYDRWAEIYDDDGNPLVALEEPLTRHHLGGVAGLRVLDAGCGTGRHALPLARAGAAVTAIDFSEGMLARARAKPDADRVTWLVHDLSRRLPFDDASFDRVLGALVLDHIADPPAFFGELARVCDPRGRIVLAAMHPAMLLKGVQARFTDPATGLKTPIQSVPNQISGFVMAAERATLRFAHMSEHAPDASLAERLPRARPYLGWPMLLVMVLEPRDR